MFSCCLLSRSEALKPVWEVPVVEDKRRLRLGEPPQHQLLQASFWGLHVEVNTWLLLLHPLHVCHELTELWYRAPCILSVRMTFDSQKEDGGPHLTMSVGRLSQLNGGIVSVYLPMTLLPLIWPSVSFYYLCSLSQIEL